MKREILLAHNWMIVSQHCFICKASLYSIESLNIIFLKRAVSLLLVNQPECIFIYVKLPLI